MMKQWHAYDEGCNPKATDVSNFPSPLSKKNEVYYLNKKCGLDSICSISSLNKQRRFLDLPLEYWQRSPDCSDAKRRHLHWIDWFCDDCDDDVKTHEKKFTAERMDESVTASSISSEYTIGNINRLCVSVTTDDAAPSSGFKDDLEPSIRMSGRERLVLLTTLCGKDIALEKNMFPYCTPRHVRHYTLWSIRDLSHEEIVEFVDAWFYKRYYEGGDSVDAPCDVTDDDGNTDWYHSESDDSLSDYDIAKGDQILHENVINKTTRIVISDKIAGKDKTSKETGLKRYRSVREGDDGRGGLRKRRHILDAVDVGRYSRVASHRHRKLYRPLRWQYDDNMGTRSFDLFHVHVYVEMVPFAFNARPEYLYEPPHVIQKKKESEKFEC